MERMEVAQLPNQRLRRNSSCCSPRKWNFFPREREKYHHTINGLAQLLIGLSLDIKSGSKYIPVVLTFFFLVFWNLIVPNTWVHSPK